MVYFLDFCGDGQLHRDCSQMSSLRKRWNLQKHAFFVEQQWLIYSDEETLTFLLLYSLIIYPINDLSVYHR